MCGVSNVAALAIDGRVRNPCNLLAAMEHPSDTWHSKAPLLLQRIIYLLYLLSPSLSLSLFLVEWIRLREGEEEECVRNAVHSRIVASVVAQKGSSTQKEKCRDSSLRWSKVRSIETKLKFQFE